MCINLIFIIPFKEGTIISQFYEWQVIKECEGSGILPYLHTSKLFLVIVLWMLREDSASGSDTRGLSYSCHSRQLSFMFVLVPVLHAPQRLCRVALSELSHRRGTLNLGTPVFYNELEANRSFVLKGELISALKGLML